MHEMRTLTVGGYTFTIVDAESVKYVPQDPTAAEQAQAQENLNVKNITVMVAPIDGGNRLIFVDANGTHPVDIMDGVSPSVTLERTEDGVLISITDKNGTTTEEVKDGQSGEGGTGDLTGYATEEWVAAGYQPKGNYLTEVPDGYAKTEDIPTKPEDIGAQPAGNYALKSEIPSVPVQSVNGKTGAVKLSASDVGARPSDWTPTAQEVGALPSTYTPPNQTAEQVGADPKGTAATAVSQHNTAGDAHGDIRLALQEINDRMTAFFDSDDQTLDELSEIVAYITSNKSLIDAITTSKVSVLDIVNNLTTNVANKPLSAAQGVALKALVDAVNSSKLDAAALTTAINTALAQAKERGEFDGKDGTSVTVESVSESTVDGGSNVVTFSDGKTLTVKNGGKGDTGAAGVSVSSVKQTTTSSADGGNNVATVTLSNGATSTFSVKNGSKGSTGAKGDTGPLPVKGTDYFTAADQEAFVQQVLNALGKPVVGEIDANKNITLVGDLASGVYNVKYENENGELVDVGQLEVGGVAYTNWLPKAEELTSAAVYNGKGWKEDTRLNTDGTDKTGATGFVATGLIPCGNTATIRVKSNVAVTNGDSSQAICFFDTNKNHITRYNWAALNTTSIGTLITNSDGSIEYQFKAANKPDIFSGKTVGWFRLAFPGINDSTIITVNEEIV